MKKPAMRFYSNGKLLIAGEYLVLDGAKAFALPTKFGQDMVVAPGNAKQIAWKSFDNDGSVWFEEVIPFAEIIAHKDPHAAGSVRNTLIEILHEAFLLGGNLTDSDGYTIETHLTFPKFWGLGTSSTLINNIAQWLRIDAFKLLQNSFGGSGYDIAAAQNDSAILYRLENGQPIVEKVNFNPVFADNLYFVYLNRKQSSKAAIASYYANRGENLAERIAAVDKITDRILKAENAGVFVRELEKHESILSGILEMETVSETFFSDFPGTVKSLGGWGGDFILAVSKENPTSYFKDRGFDTVIP